MIRHRWAPSPEVFPSRDGGRTWQGRHGWRGGRRRHVRPDWWQLVGEIESPGIVNTMAGGSARSVLGMGRRGPGETRAVPGETRAVPGETRAVPGETRVQIAAGDDGESAA